MAVFHMSLIIIIMTFAGIPTLSEAGIKGLGVAHCNSCSENAVCLYAGMRDGQYEMECICMPLYQGDGNDCKNIDECHANTDNCHVNALCTDLDPGFSCTCLPGFVGDGVTCNDVKECESGKTNLCPSNAVCRDTEGSFVCDCQDGYHLVNGTCEDINECTSGDNLCHEYAHCYNTEGSYNCTCSKGYQGNGSVCEEMDIIKNKLEIQIMHQSNVILRQLQTEQAKSDLLKHEIELAEIECSRKTALGSKITNVPPQRIKRTLNMNISETKSIVELRLDLQRQQKENIALSIQLSELRLKCLLE